MDNMKNIVGEVFHEVANAIQTGNFGSKAKVGLTTFGSEHGTDELVKGAEMATKAHKDIEIWLIGPKVDTSLKIVEVNSENEMYNKMDELLDLGQLDAAVTMHYNFPIGVSSVGRVVTPGFGKELILATTTGTSSTNRVVGMVKNAICGIITAKALGIEHPTIGILNVDGARQVKRVLKELRENGYEINLAKSLRADGGCIMRGNDLLIGSSDVMVMDTLTGNIVTKVLSSFTTGGSYESIGYGYGPGVGDGYEKIICILSRASGAPVVCEALGYAASCVKGGLTQVAKDEFVSAKKAGLDEILRNLVSDTEPSRPYKIKMPNKKIVTEAISGIDILELDNAVAILAKENIYSESGMGCTGPIVLTAEDDYDEAVKILMANKLTSQNPVD